MLKGVNEKDLLNPDNDLDEDMLRMLARNPGIFELDYEAIRKQVMIFKEELMTNVYHPLRIHKILDLLEKKGEDISCIENYI